MWIQVTDEEAVECGWSLRAAIFCMETYEKRICRYPHGWADVHRALFWSRPLWG